MGDARFMTPVDNLITASTMIVPTSTASGVLSNAQKEGAGAGTMGTSGEYTGSVDRDYFVQIDTAGALGVATFKWSRDDGGTFAASGVLTSASAVALEDGISVLFGAGPFTLGDLWRFKAFRPFGTAKLLDGNRNTEWRSGPDITGAIDLSIDLGAAGILNALVIDKHNFTSAAVIRFQADDAAGYGSLNVDELVTWAKDQIIHYPTTTPRTFRYVRLRVTDAANPSLYLRIANLHVGGYRQPSTNFRKGFARSRQRFTSRTRGVSGTPFGGLNAMAELFEVQWRLLQSADRVLLLDVYAALMDETSLAIKPVFFHADSAVATFTRLGLTYGDVYLCDWEDDLALRHIEDSVDDYDAAVRLLELPRTRT